MVSAAYRPPEYDAEDGKVGRSHDIWALGCLYLEMLAWLFDGWKGVQGFEAARKAEKTSPCYTGPNEGAFFKVKFVGDGNHFILIVKPTVTKVS